MSYAAIQPVMKARLSWTYLIGIVTLSGYFWSNLSSVLTIIILTSASRDSSEAAERLQEPLRWPTAINVAFLMTVTVLLVVWIAYGQRFQNRWPRLALALVAIAVLPHFIMHLGLAYWMFVHGGA